MVKDGSGNYDGGSYEDEYFWALTELYLSTGKRQYLDYLTGKKKIAGYPGLQNLLVKPDIHGPADWGMGEAPTTGVVNLAYFSILMSPQSAAPIDVSSVKAALMRFADLVIGQIGSNPYRVPLDRTEFVWGSNAIAANKAVILAYAYHLTGDAKYLDGIYDVLHYVFGRNALAISMVTGHGFSYPRNPHHRISASRADQTPTPGMLVGGPNQRKEDRLDYGSCLPERCYLDESASFASNEVAINWNAPLALILATVLNDQPPLKN
jgi:endoglucanase